MALDKGKGTSHNATAPNALNLDDTNSEAIKSFDAKFLLVREGIYALNPHNGCIAGTDLKDAPLNYLNTHSKDLTESDKRLRILGGFYKSAVVNLMVVFEGYVHDLFTEAFTFTFWDGIKNPRHKCEDSWPAVKELVMKLVTNNTNKPEKKNEFFDIVRDQDVWQYLLKKHRDDTLSYLSPRITTMQTVLQKLFIIGEKNEKDTKKKPHVEPRDSANQAAGGKPDTHVTHAMEIMLQNGSFNTKWNIPGQYEQHDVIIDKIHTLTHILDLFYAIRCISVHGKPEPTLDGVLANFPRADAPGPRTMDLKDDVVEKYLFDIHDELQQGELQFDYFLCINVSRFIKTTAIGLQRALGYFIFYQLKYSDYYKEKHTFWGLVRDSRGHMDVPQLKKDKKQNISTKGAAGIPEKSVAGDDEEE